MTFRWQLSVGRSRASLLVVLAILISVSCDGEVPSSERFSFPKPMDDLPLLSADHGPLPSDAVNELTVAIHVPEETLTVETSVTIDESFFAIVDTGSEGDSHYVQIIGRLVDGTWTIQDVFSSEGLGSSLYVPLPEPGSGRVAWGPLSSDDADSYIGFVDPTITRVEALSGDGSLLDATEPTDNGAFSLLVEPWAQLRVFRDGLLVAATLVSYSESLADEPAPSSIDVAKRFVSALQSGDTEGAADLLADDLPSDQVLPLLEEVLSPLRDVAIRPKLEGRVVKVEFVGTEDIFLVLYLSELANEFRIITYSFGIDVSLD